MRYVIVGNGVAGITAAFTLRQHDARAVITVIGRESDYFFSRTGLMYVYMDRMTLRDLEPYERKVYRRERIDLLRGEVVDLDARAHQLTLRDGSRIPYDRLLLATGSCPVSPQWKGLDALQTGAVHFVSAQDLAECERLTRRGEPAMVVGGGLIGIELVECLRHHGMPVTFLVREPWYYPAALAAPEAEMVTEHIRAHGVEVVLDELVEAVHANEQGEVRGLTGESGHFYPCSLLGIAIGVRPAVDWLYRTATPPRLERGIVVDAGFQTTLDHVFAAGDCAEITAGEAPGFIEQLWYSARRQGDLVARAMLGHAIQYQAPVFYNSAKFFGIEYTTVGRCSGSADEFYARVKNGEASVRIAAPEGVVAGFNLLGSRWNHAVLEEWIAARQPLNWVIAHLHEAQFDAEFCRLNLEAIRRQFAVWAAERSTATAAGVGEA
jgi:NADPH-dependent 2,4-dienoyl-CoA reductase/sulfur reductase-like enzyme